MIFVIYGCRAKRVRITVMIVDFVVSEVEKISAIAMIVVCVLMHSYLMITTAKLENTCPIAPSVKKICFHRDMQVTKCHAVMLFTGTASRN